MKSREGFHRVYQTVSELTCKYKYFNFFFLDVDILMNRNEALDTKKKHKNNYYYCTLIDKYLLFIIFIFTGHSKTSKVHYFKN